MVETRTPLEQMEYLRYCDRSRKGNTIDGDGDTYVYPYRHTSKLDPRRYHLADLDYNISPCHDGIVTKNFITPQLGDSTGLPYTYIHTSAGVRYPWLGGDARHHRIRNTLRPQP